MAFSAPKPNRRVKPNVRVKREKAPGSPPEKTVRLLSPYQVRARAEARRRLWGRVKLALFFAGAYVAFLGAFLLWQELYIFIGDKHYFDLKHVEITGLHRASEAEMMHLSELPVGHSIFSVDLKRARVGIERHPWVKHVRLTRHLPDSVRIEVTENEPKALLAIGERRYYVNDEGTPFKPESTLDAVPSDLVRIDGLEGGDLEPLEKGQRKLKRALELIDTYRAHALATLAPLNAVTYRYDGFELNVGAGHTTLVLGKNGDTHTLDRAARLLRYLGERGEQAETIHLDNRLKPERVSVRLHSLETEAPALVGVALGH